MLVNQPIQYIMPTKQTNLNELMRRQRQGRLWGRQAHDLQLSSPLHILRSSEDLII